VSLGGELPGEWRVISYPAKTYCHFTGLAPSNKDPCTNLRYANADLFKRVRSLSAGNVESYLALRKAAVVLKGNSW